MPSEKLSQKVRKQSPTILSSANKNCNLSQSRLDLLATATAKESFMDLPSRRKLSYDIAHGDNDVYPEYHSEDFHGTSMAGLVGATANNSECTVGIAYEAGLGMMRVVSKDHRQVTDAEYARAVTMASDAGADVLVFGQGPADTGGVATAMGLLRRDAHSRAVAGGKGRAGKGLLVSGRGEWGTEQIDEKIKCEHQQHRQ